MEFAFDAKFRNYAGGLGVLAADMMHSCADMSIPAVGVSLIYHKDDNPEKALNFEKYMKRLSITVDVQVEDRPVKVGVFEYTVKSDIGKSLPVYFLTTYLPENKRWDRDLTKFLYAGDEYTRIGQETILGIGGVKMLRALGYNHIEKFHMNEGHSAFLTFELLKECAYHDADVRKMCTFTTHTPIPAGHDYFDYHLAERVLTSILPWHIKNIATSDRLSMTHLALNLSEKVNSVSEKHNEVCHQMFPEYSFENITNGIHHLTWISDSMAKLFDSSFLHWRERPSELCDAENTLSGEKVWQAHQKNKKELVKWINEHPEYYIFSPEKYKEDFFDENTLTIAFARRFVPYKRPTLIFRDIDRLRELGYRKIQMVFSGKCYEFDQFCNWQKGNLQKFEKMLRGQIRIAVISDYNVDIAQKLISGADMWLNNPVRPLEASGTSGMKAALNGLLNISVLDGWWIEGFALNPMAGWGFGEKSNGLDENSRDNMDAHELYENLTDAVNCYYHRPEEWRKRMKAAISLIHYFNTNRCVEEYMKKMWSFA
ncbi:alpha-glucan family phosphorylase [Candidatus Peregrinibacteria bacterium]|nr:alpha-glucan family phosphorylase [Candidatus Peregrinibacteria bacterium]